MKISLEQKRNTAQFRSFKPLGLAVFVAWMFSLSSCTNNREASAQYYAIDSLIKAQISYLPSTNARLTKKSRLDNRTDTTVLTPADTTIWSAELDVFRQLADINKPINSGAYIIHDDLPDPQSNLSIKSFTGTKKQSVAYLKLYYQDTLSKLRKIEALYREENILYKNARILTMEFQDINNKMIVTSYSIYGGQKMFLGDSVVFSIQGEIKIK